MFCTLVSRNVIVEFVSKERAVPVWCCNKQTKHEGRNFLNWASIAPIESCVTYLLRIARARPTKILRQSFSPKLFWISIHTNQLQTLVQFRLSVGNIRV